MSRIILFCVAVLAASSNQARAQEGVYIPTIWSTLQAAQVTELEKWFPAEVSWQRWYKGGHAAMKHGARPTLLPWLDAWCGRAGLFEGTLSKACELRKGDVAAGKIVAAAVEEPRKNVWFEHLQVGGGYPMLMSRSGNLLQGFMAFDLHWSFPVKKGDRMEVNLPGVAVARIPDSKGRPTFKFAWTVGLSLRLSEFKLPFAQQHAMIYLNLMNAFPQGGGVENLIDKKLGRSFVGFSIAYLKK